MHKMVGRRPVDGQAPVECAGARRNGSTPMPAVRKNVAFDYHRTEDKVTGCLDMVYY